MPKSPDNAAPHAASVVRVAWPATFVVPLLLAVLLLGVKSAQAEPLPAADPLAFEEEFEAEEEGEFEADECEEAEEEFEEGELSGAEVKEYCDETEGKHGKGASGSGSPAPEECLLRSFHARAVAGPEGDELKLTVGYTTYEPADATVEIHGGADRIGSLHRQLGRSGVLRIVQNLGKDRPPHRIVVRIRIPGSPLFCGKFQTQKIPVSEVGSAAAARHARHPRGR